MGVYFGTDGFRGIYGQTLSPEITQKIGNALGKLCGQRKKVLVGRDTRCSGSLLTLALANGLMSYGIDVVDIGIAPTPAIAFLAKKFDFNYGVVISASHNPKEYNGIKIFDSNGYKISEEEEFEIERNLLYTRETTNERLGRYQYRPKLKKAYKQTLLGCCEALSGLKIALDLANGASYSIAKEIFSKTGARIIIRNNQNNGKKINVDCGALYPEYIAHLTKEMGCDMGFSFDGDADRIIACDENGNILDGDDILYILSQFIPTKHVVGTSMTNKGLELALSKQEKVLLRSDVGDKYVSLLMRSSGAAIGGEPSGHIICNQYSTTGDGMLTALLIASHVKKTGQKLSSLCNYEKMPQVTKNIEVVDKYRILNSDYLSAKILAFTSEIGQNGRVLVRASGTENKIRIMCEHKDEKKAREIVELLSSIVENINKKD